MAELSLDHPADAFSPLPERFLRVVFFVVFFPLLPIVPLLNLWPPMAPFRRWLFRDPTRFWVYQNTLLWPWCNLRRLANRCVGLQLPLCLHARVVTGSPLKPSDVALRNDLPAKGSGTMRIVCISDTHGHHRAIPIPAGDILVHAGDLFIEDRGLTSSLGGERSRCRLERMGAWLADLPFAHVVCIGGNHDAILQDLGATEVRRALNAHRRGSHVSAEVHYLADEGIEINGLSIYGAPLSVQQFKGSQNRAFQVSAQQDAAADRAPMVSSHGRVDVLITHGPPKGVLDAGKGSELVADAVRQLHPTLHFFGRARAPSLYRAPVRSLVSLRVCRPTPSLRGGLRRSSGDNVLQCLDLRRQFRPIPPSSRG